MKKSIQYILDMTYFYEKAEVTKKKNWVDNVYETIERNSNLINDPMESPDLEDMLNSMEPAQVAAITRIVEGYEALEKYWEARREAEEV